MKITLKSDLISKYPIAYANVFYQMTGNAKVPTMKHWVDAVEAEAKSIKFKTEDEENTFKGDMLEVLAEIFFNANVANARYGIKGYKPVALEQDRGVDAIGKNPANDDCVVQVKYRKNPSPRKDEERLHWPDLAKTYASGVRSFNIDTKKKSTVFLFTTLYEERGISYVIKEELGDCLVILDRKFIDAELENNHNFWDIAYETVLEYLKAHGHPCVA